MATDLPVICPLCHRRRWEIFVEGQKWVVEMWLATQSASDATAIWRDVICPECYKFEELKNLVQPSISIEGLTCDSIHGVHLELREER